MQRWRLVLARLGLLLVVVLAHGCTGPGLEPPGDLDGRGAAPVAPEGPAPGMAPAPTDPADPAVGEPGPDQAAGDGDGDAAPGEDFDDDDDAGMGEAGDAGLPDAALQDAGA